MTAAQARTKALRTLKVGQRVRVNIKGRQFWAVLTEEDSQVRGGWVVEPESRNVTYRHILKRNIMEVEQAWSPDSTQHRHPR